MSPIGSIYRDCLGSFVRENLCISERVLTQRQSRERTTRARQLALSQRLSKINMNTCMQASEDIECTSSLERHGNVSHIVELDQLRVVFVSTEVAPWSKVGGLADVIGALPKALAGFSHSWNIPFHSDDNVLSPNKQVNIGQCSIWSISPMYEEYEGLVDCGLDVPIPDYHITDKDENSTDDMKKNARLYECFDNGVRRVFVKHPLLDMHGIKTPVPDDHPSLTYLDADGGVYNCRNVDARYDTLAWGALSAATLLSGPGDMKEGERRHNVVFVLNDWPTALHILRLKHLIDSKMNHAMYEKLSPLEKSITDSLGVVKTIFCIHNLAYQGVFSMDSICETLTLSPSALLSLSTDIPWEKTLNTAHDEEDVNVLDVKLDDNEESINTVNFMRAALLLSDQIVTVSPHYADEIMSEEDCFNCGMGSILKYRKVLGIMNGIDVQEWDPVSDGHIPIDGNYGVISAKRGKTAMKKHLQRRLGLDVDDAAMLIVFIGRLTEQKGVDVLLGAILRLLPQKPAPKPANAAVDDGGPATTHGQRLQVAVLGTGDQWMERSVQSLEHSFPGNAKGICTFSEELAHWMLAAGDYAVIPSKFEPCGLIAQCAARYGAVPIMTATGGLKNLGDNGVGILVSQHTDLSKSVDALVQGIIEAQEMYGSDVYREKQIACMEYDFSWDKSAKDWQYIIAKILLNQEM